MAGDDEDDRPQLLGDQGQGDDKQDTWLVTFTDLVALLLTFFVMLYAMKSVDNAKWQNMTDSLQRHLSSITQEKRAAPSLQLNMPGKDIAPGADLDYVGQVIRSQLSSNAILDRALVQRQGSRLFVSLPSDLLFPSGQHQLTGKARKAIFALGGFLRNISNRVEVAGHADPRKPTRQYPSNWELSVLRARQVATALQQSGYRGGVTTYGYGHAQFDNLPDDLDKEKRQKLGRRVDIVISRAAREDG